VCVCVCVTQILILSVIKVPVNNKSESRCSGGDVKINSRVDDMGKST